MIDLKDLRENPDRYREGAAAKGIHVDVDQLLALDERLRAATTERESLAAEKNRVGKEIGRLAGMIKKAAGEQRAELESQMTELREAPTRMKDRERELDELLRSLEVQRDQIWLQVPQPPDDDVPRGRSAEDNVELRTWSPPGFDLARTFEQNRGFTPKGHADLGRDLGLIDFERGVRLSGTRSYVLRGDGMRLHLAVLRCAMDMMTTEHGFTPLSAPPLVRERVLTGTGFFPHGRDSVYQIENPTGDESLFLTGTGEAGLMGYHDGEILDADALPLKYVTVSTCFRRESGAAGKDTAGLYRVHQFDKVEQVVICRADTAESRQWHQRMIGFVETFLQRLELPYRLLQCCTADLGPKNADMIDLECWMPSRGAAGPDGLPTGDWGETHSASRLYDYQCRRLNIRYRDGGSNVVAHSLNNTVAASPRILIPILEMYQNADGTVTVPAILRPYMGGLERIGG